MTKNQAKRRRRAEKNKVPTPWNLGGVANDLYDELKKRERLKKSKRRLKKIRKELKKTEGENKDEATTDTLSSREEKEDFLVVSEG
jgi:hypothetical protein